MRHTIVRDGIVAGVIGATSVAVWFLVIDLVLGRLLHTPTALGQAFLGIFDPVTRPSPDLVAVSVYTLFHYLAFIVAGLLVAAIVQWAERQPTVLAGALILFIVFEVGFHALISMFSAFPMLGVTAWYNVALGNLVAALSMGTYMWRAHPALKAELKYALESRE